MAMIVTLKSVNSGLHTVEIKREIGAGKETRKFSKAGLSEYLESAKAYCDHKGYDFIYRQELTEEEAYAKFDDIGAKVADQELGFQKDWAKNAGKEMTCRFFIENWVIGEGKSIAVIVYWDGEAVETYKFGIETEEDESELQVLKENFTIAFAATIEEPSDEEVEYIFSLLPLSEIDYDFTTHLHSCSIPCDCDPDTIVYGFKFESPYQEEEERKLSVILCSDCGKWACCD